MKRIASNIDPEERERQRREARLELIRMIARQIVSEALAEGKTPVFEEPPPKSIRKRKTRGQTP